MTATKRTPADVLAHSRVDVITLIRDGIPAREYVPGGRGFLPKGKRIHNAADAKTGKSLSIAVVTAIDIVQAGGTVIVLDRENGADEYARRLEAVLDARAADDTFRDQLKDRLRYHAWPTLRLEWREDPAYPDAFAGADVVIFDSSRSHLTPLGLKEDQADDYAAFTTGLIDPLMQAGITTITLDNTGHTEKGRARGTSAKGDLCDLAFTMKVTAPFSSTLAGHLQLRCTASRIGEIAAGDTWEMPLGDGYYGSWQPAARPAGDTPAAFRPTNIMEKLSRAIEHEPGLSRNALITATGKRKEHVALALELLIADGYVEARRDGQTHRHYPLRIYSAADDPTGSQPGPNRVPDPVERTGSPGSPPYGGTGTGPGTNGNHNRVPQTSLTPEHAETLIAQEETT